MSVSLLLFAPQQSTSFAVIGASGEPAVHTIENTASLPAAVAAVVPLADISAVYFVSGPGSFIGLRAAASLAQGLHTLGGAQLFVLSHLHFQQALLAASGTPATVLHSAFTRQWLRLPVDGSDILTEEPQQLTGPVSGFLFPAHLPFLSAVPLPLPALTPALWAAVRPAFASAAVAEPLYGRPPRIGNSMHHLQ